VGVELVWLVGITGGGGGGSGSEKLNSVSYGNPTTRRLYHWYNFRDQALGLRLNCTINGVYGFITSFGAECQREGIYYILGIILIVIKPFPFYL
jgi:hypothetical protein